MTFDLKMVLPLGTETEAQPSRHPHDVYLTLLCLGRRALDDILAAAPPSLRRYECLPYLGERSVWTKLLLNAADQYVFSHNIPETPEMVDAYRRAFVQNMKRLYPDFGTKQEPS